MHPTADGSSAYANLFCLSSVWRGMATPSAVMANCDECGEVTHRVLKGKISGRLEIVFRGVVKCQSCGKISEMTIREVKEIKVPIILSWMGDSQKIQQEMDPDVILRVGDIIEIDSGKAEITAIESSERRVPECQTRDVDTLWAKRADQIRVKVSLLRKGKISPRDIFVAPDHEFCVGDSIDVGKFSAVIRQIKVARRTLYKGCARASIVKRIFAKGFR